MEWLELLKYIAYLLIVIVVPIISKYIIGILESHRNKINTDNDQTLFNQTLSRVLLLISDIVAEVSQTYVDSLKSAGEFTEESQKIAFNKAKDTVLSLLTEESKEIITTLYGDIDTWITVQIEATVRSQKNH